MSLVGGRNGGASRRCALIRNIFHDIRMHYGIFEYAQLIHHARHIDCLSYRASETVCLICVCETYAGYNNRHYYWRKFCLIRPSFCPHKAVRARECTHPYKRMRARCDRSLCHTVWTDAMNGHCVPRFRLSEHTSWQFSGNTRMD